MIVVKHHRATLIHLGLAIAGIVGISLGEPLLTTWWHKALATFILCVLVSFLIIGRDKRVYVFNSESPKLEKFFLEWYAKDGELMIYCSDLEWIGARVKDGLLLKASKGQLRLYLKNLGDNSNFLKTHGAVVHRIPPTITSAHRFSILKADEFERIICRNKFLEPQEARSQLVEFISATSTSDPYLIALAKDVLSSCPKEP